MKTNLTRRENQVMQLASRGETNKGIAQALKLSEQTVKNHVHNAYQKLGVQNRVQAALAYNKGESWFSLLRKRIATFLLLVVLVRTAWRTR